MIISGRHTKPVEALVGDIPVWYHEPCGTLNLGPWESGKFCQGCRFEVTYAGHVNIYLMTKVAGSNRLPEESQ